MQPFFLFLFFFFFFCRFPINCSLLELVCVTYEVNEPAITITPATKSQKLVNIFFSYLYSHLSFHFSCLMVYVVLTEKQFKNKPESVRIQQDQNLTLPVLQLINIRIRKIFLNVHIQKYNVNIMSMETFRISTFFPEHYQEIWFIANRVRNASLIWNRF